MIGKISLFKGGGVTPSLENSRGRSSCKCKEKNEIKEKDSPLKTVPLLGHCLQQNVPSIFPNSIRPCSISIRMKIVKFLSIVDNHV